MKRILWLLAFFALAAPAQAADNVAVTPGSGKTMGCLDISTVCFSKLIIYDTTGAALFASGNAGYVRFSSAQAVTLASTTITGSVAVTGTFWQTTQPVSGTFWQATQPVSLATAPTTPVTGTFWQTTQPVSGTFYQATQPVSIATMPSTPVTGSFYQDR